MIQQGFHIGDKDWYVMCSYDICTQKDLRAIEQLLYECGGKPKSIDEAISVLKQDNTGFTYTSFDDKITVIFIGHATSEDEMYNIIQHELKHAVEHISEYYDVDPKSETAAYLQGEIARNMYAAAVYIVCPNK